MYFLKCSLSFSLLNPVSLSPSGWGLQSSHRPGTQCQVLIPNDRCSSLLGAINARLELSTVPRHRVQSGTWLATGMNGSWSEPGTLQHFLAHEGTVIAVVTRENNQSHTYSCFNEVNSQPRQSCLELRSASPGLQPQGPRAQLSRSSCSRCLSGT